MIAPDRIQRFWSHVQKTDGCWIWTGSKRDGYGLFQSSKGKFAGNAHRVSWIIANGPIRRGLLALHKCDNRACVKPSHLFIGTMQDNMDDRNRKGRQARGERHSRARLTEQQVLKIRQLKERGVYVGWGVRRDIAMRFCVSGETIASIWAGRSWRHL